MVEAHHHAQPRCITLHPRVQVNKRSSDVEFESGSPLSRTEDRRVADQASASWKIESNLCRPSPPAKSRICAHYITEVLQAAHSSALVQ